MEPASRPATKMLSYVDGDLGDDASDEAMSQAGGPGKELVFCPEC
jgi:hypothetical protein